MSDDPTPLKTRSTRLSRFALLRSSRLARSGGRALARTVVARHDVRRLVSPPRLAPAKAATVARAVAPDAAPPDAAPLDDEARRGEAERLSELSGYSPKIMEYLVDNARPVGPAPPALGDAGDGARLLARLPASGPRLAAPRRSAIVEDGAPRALRLSRTPAASASSPPAPPVEAGPPVEAARAAPPVEPGPPSEAAPAGAAPPVEAAAPVEAAPQAEAAPPVEAAPQAEAAPPAEPLPAAEAAPDLAALRAFDDAPSGPDGGEEPAAPPASPAPATSRLTLARRPAAADDEPATASAPPAALRLARRIAPPQPDAPPPAGDSATGPPAAEPRVTRGSSPLGRLWRRVVSGVRGSEPAPEPAPERPSEAIAAPRARLALARTPIDEATPEPALDAAEADDAQAPPPEAGAADETLARVAIDDATPLAPTPIDIAPARLAPADDAQAPRAAPAPQPVRLGPRPSAGGAPAGVARSVARGVERPRLHVQRREAPDAPAATTAPGGALATAKELARATAGAIEYEDEGRVSVLLPPPGSVFAAPSRAIAREESIAEPAEPPAIADPAPAESLPPAEPAEPAAPAAPAAALGLDRDELYADFAQRLRRDILEQREQRGEL